MTAHLEGDFKVLPVGGHVKYLLHFPLSFQQCSDIAGSKTHSAGLSPVPLNSDTLPFN